MKEVILEAGEILKKGFLGAKEVEKKGKVDLVTSFDLEIEKFLRKGLEKKYKGFEFVGEESFNEKVPKNAIIVDPIDGTTNFVHQLVYTAISVAIQKDGEIVEGAVYNPILKEFFYAKKGKGAFLNDKKIEVDKRVTLINSLIATGFPYTKTSRSRDYLFTLCALREVLPLCRDVRRLGSASIDLAYVAMGRFGGFFETNLKPWDTGAGILLVEEAGGVVSNHLGNPYRFGDIILASSPSIHSQLLEILHQCDKAK